MSDSDNNEVKKDVGDSDLIGVDPLAWLSEEEKESVLQQSKQQEEPVLENEVPDEETKSDITEVADNPDNPVDESDNSTYKIDLDTAVTIRDVAELMDELSFIEPDVTEVIFECSQIEKTDAAAVQLLTGYYLFAKEEGKKVVWSNPTEAFCHSVNLLGLGDILNISLAA